MRGIHRWPASSPRKGPVTRKMFPLDNVNMRFFQCLQCAGSVFLEFCNRLGIWYVIVLPNTYQFSKWYEHLHPNSLISAYTLTTPYESCFCPRPLLEGFNRVACAASLSYYQLKHWLAYIMHANSAPETMMDTQLRVKVKPALWVQSMTD